MPDTAPPPHPSDSPPPAASPSGLHRVQLEAYAGPLDLLLYLVKRHEIDLHNIPMAELVEQYLSHLRVIETVDVDQAGDFLVMAATLVEIKSRMILPPSLQPEDDEPSGDRPADGAGGDPRFELVQQLLAYKQFKDAANALEDRAEDWDSRFPASAKSGAGTGETDDAATDTTRADLDIDDVNVLDLCSAFGRVMEGIGHLGDHAVTYDDTPISLHADDIADRLRRDGGDGCRLNLRAIFSGRNRSEMIGLFLATLELVRQRKVKVLRGTSTGDPDQMALELQPEDQWLDVNRIENETAPDWTDPQTGDVQYDWPDEASRLRNERRQRRREAIREGKLQADAEDDDFEETDAEVAESEPNANEKTIGLSSQPGG